MLVKNEGIYTNALKSAEDVRQTMVVANAQLQVLLNEKNTLDNDVATLQQQNEQVQQSRELSALRHLSGITSQITTVKSALSRLGQ